MTWGQTAKEIDRHLEALGAARIIPCRLGDEQTGELPLQFDTWASDVLQALGSSAATEKFVDAPLQVRLLYLFRPILSFAVLLALPDVQNDGSACTSLNLADVEQ